MGCFGISSCFIWQGEDKPESLSLVILPGLPQSSVLVTSQDFLLQTSLGLAGELVKKEPIHLNIPFFKREMTVLNLRPWGISRLCWVFLLIFFSWIVSLLSLRGSRRTQPCPLAPQRTEHSTNLSSPPASLLSSSPPQNTICSLHTNELIDV